MTEKVLGEVAELVNATATAQGFETLGRSHGRACGRPWQQRGTHSLQVRVLPSPPLPAAGAVQDALNPGRQGFPSPLRCGLVAGLPVLADADMQVRGLPVIDGGPASGALGFFHDPIIGSNICVDNYYLRAFNVNTLNQEQAMKRAFTAPVDSERCDGQAVSAANGEGCRCMHRARHGQLCQQHAYQRAADALKATLAALTQPRSFPADIEAARSYVRGALNDLGEI